MKGVINMSERELKIWCAVKFKKQAPFIIDFLIEVSLGEKMIDNNLLKRNNILNYHNYFDILHLRNFHPFLQLSGDRVLRQLREDGLIKYECISQHEGIYKLKSDIFELHNAKQIIERGGYFKEIKPQLDLWEGLCFEK